MITGSGRCRLPAWAQWAAVRSSGALEDTSEASFAGQYRTLLDVSPDAVARSVETVRRSAADAAGYAQALGLHGAPAPSSLPVLVQRFVEARAAGVVFTRHPLDPGAMLVESHAGPGEAVVSGTVRPERYALDRETGELRDGAPRGSLAADLHQVFLLARRAEELLGAPQDVEWAIHGGSGPQIVLLQSRPETVWSSRAASPVAAPTAQAFDHVLHRLSAPGRTAAP